MLTACERYICQLFAPKATFTRANQLRWHLFKKLKPNQGIENLLPSPGAIVQNVCRSHLACNVWRQVLLRHPSLLEPTDLGWQNVGELNAILTNVPLASEALVQLVFCNYEKSKCGGRCKC